MLNPRIVELKEKKLVGKSLTMSFANYKIGALFGSFMPFRKEIKNKINSDLISLVIYKPDHFEYFKPTNEFVRWAVVEVSDWDAVSPGMETFLLKSGLYAVFDYVGSSQDHTIFQKIVTEWLPASSYLLDDRPHFEVLGQKYKNNDPTSEEEIWIPIKQK